MQMGDVISMKDMGMIFGVTDGLGIDREMLRVELVKEDPGSVKRAADGTVEIIVPLSTPIERWLPRLKSELQQLGLGEPRL